MESTIYISELLQNNYALFSAMYAFNNELLPYLHTDYLDGMPVDVLKSLSESPQSRGKVIAYLRKELKLDTGVYNFDDVRYYLCLLSADEINKIICYIGGICFSEQIRKTILGRELVKIRRTIGEDAYAFSLRTAPLFVKSNVAEQFRADGNTLVERMLNTGKSLIEMSLDGLPESLEKRFVLKFPKNFGWNFHHQVEDPNYYFGFIKKVIKRVLADDNNIAVAMIKAEHVTH